MEQQADFTLTDILVKAIASKASDVHLVTGVSPYTRVDGQLRKLDEYPIMTSEEIKKLLFPMLPEEELKELGKSVLEWDTSFGVKGLGRFRVNVYHQRGSVSAAIRILSDRIPTFSDLGVPIVMAELVLKPRGLILVTGPTGSGKSTTLASAVNYINHNRSCHLLTIEDPIEYLHRHGKGIINQREVGKDTPSFPRALRSALREDPDVIMVGEMRDLESISSVITLAETGHLVLATVHTNSASQTIDRMIDVFHSAQQNQIRYQLSEVLEGIISQLLLPHASGRGRVLVTEVMVATQAVRNLIREGKANQLPTIIQTGSDYGMHTMDQDLVRLVLAGRISQRVALGFAFNRREMERILREKGVYKDGSV